MINLRHSLVLLFVSGGCATPMTEMRSDNHNLNQTVVELRAERREQMRKLEDLEHQLTALRVRALPDGAPNLPVVVAAPASVAVSATPTAAPAPTDLANGQRLVGVSDDGGEIVYEGDAAAGKVATLDDDDTNAANALTAAAPPRRARVTHDSRDTARDADITALSVPLDPDDRRSPPVADRTEITRHVPAAARSMRVHVRPDHDTAGERTAPSGDPGSEYRAAVAQLKSGDYAGAIAALHAFIAHYPRHDYADNAQYWLGEAYYVQKDYARALVEFRATIETYPRGNKVPDALLKVGYTYAAMGQDAKARAVLEQVVSLYPKSEPSMLAAKKLETP